MLIRAPTIFFILADAITEKKTNFHNNRDDTVRFRARRVAEPFAVASDRKSGITTENLSARKSLKIRNKNYNKNVNINISGGSGLYHSQKRRDKYHPAATLKNPASQIFGITEEDAADCAGGKKKNQRYTSSFRNSTNNLSVDQEFDKLVGNNSKEKTLTSVHEGEDMTLCWIETTTIKEDKSVWPPKRLVIREYTISFENSATIPDRYLECKRFEGELLANDPEIGKTALFEIIDENTRVSKIVNFTAVSHDGDIIDWKYKTVKCGVGPVVTKNIIEYTKSDNPKKRVEIKVSPKINLLAEKKSDEEPCTDSSEESSTDKSNVTESCENGSCGVTTISSKISTESQEIVTTEKTVNESPSYEDSDEILKLSTGVTKKPSSEERVTRATAAPKTSTTIFEENLNCDKDPLDPECLKQIDVTPFSKTLSTESSVELSTTEAAEKSETSTSRQLVIIPNISDYEASTKEKISSKESSIGEDKSISDFSSTEETGFVTFISDISIESSESATIQPTNTEFTTISKSFDYYDHIDTTIKSVTTTPTVTKEVEQKRATSEEISEEVLSSELIKEEVDDTDNVLFSSEISTKPDITAIISPIEHPTETILSASKQEGSEEVTFKTEETTETKPTSASKEETSEEIVTSGSEETTEQLIESATSTSEEKRSKEVVTSESEETTEESIIISKPKEEESEEIETSESEETTEQSTEGITSIFEEEGNEEVITSESEETTELSTIISKPKEEESEEIETSESEETTEQSTESITSIFEEEGSEEVITFESEETTEQSILTFEEEKSEEIVTSESEETIERSTETIISASKEEESEETTTEKEKTTGKEKLTPLTIVSSTSKSESSCEDSEDCISSSEACEESEDCGSTTKKSCESETCSEEEAITDESKSDTSSIITESSEEATERGIEYTTVASDTTISREEEIISKGENVPTTVETRRSTTSDQKHKLNLRIKILLEHVDENEKKHNLVEVEKHLSLHEDMEHHEHPDLIKQLKSLNDSVNLEALNALLNCTTLGNLTNDPHISAIPNDTSEETFKESNLSSEEDSQYSNTKLIQKHKVISRGRRRRDVEEIQDTRKDLESISQDDSTKKDEQLSTTTSSITEETTVAENLIKDETNFTTSENITKNETTDSINQVKNDVSFTTTIHNLEEETTDTSSSTQETYLFANSTEEKTTDSINIKNESTVVLTEETNKNKKKIDIVQQMLLKLREDISTGFQRIMSQLYSDLIFLNDENKTDKSDLLSIISDPKDDRIHSRKKREITKEQLGHWSNERIGEAPMGSKLRSFTEFTLFKSLS